jgi:P pilus assembly chaperone PapD
MRFRFALVALGWICAPLASHAAIIVTGSLTHELEVAPGGSYEASIDVLNQGNDPQEVRAYQTDYSFSADGSVMYGDPGKLTRSNARWLTVSPRQFTIPPNETMQIRLTVQVPNDAAMTGTYWSVVMVEPVPPGSPESSSPAPKQTGMGINQVLRYAVQVVTHLGSSGTRQLKFSQLRLTAENDKRFLVVDVQDTGERWLRGSLSVDLFDSAGKHVVKLDGGTQRMYPGTSVRFSVDLAGVQEAAYKALIVVDCGGNDVFGANVNLVLKQ